ncbi:hypothetical protein L3X38_037128 [Prunus dulcis]|uniref:Uncharacterized protein n=1 Tax=Prunus dulcis TaxID=3755 RepID=A0AAD4YQ41_PRUDU|nr:hypothetical protein L3X38_037128 [Prunus dulcis]
MAVCPRVPHAPASLESSVAQLVSARQRHRPPSTTDTTSTSAAGASESQPAKMTQFLQSLAQADVPIPPFTPSSTSEPIQPERGHHTSALIDNVQTFVLHSPEDHVDFGNLFH